METVGEITLYSFPHGLFPVMVSIVSCLQSLVKDKVDHMTPLLLGLPGSSPMPSTGMQGLRYDVIPENILCGLQKEVLEHLA